jgi:uncharacterized protein (TIGR00369 family)
MLEFTPYDDGYFERIKQAYSAQKAMHYIGAEIGDVRPGFCEIRLPFDMKLTQHDGFIHAGMIAAIADTAGGYACYTLLPPEGRVLAVEFKINFLRPGLGDRIDARAQVIKHGRTLTICRIDCYAVKGDTEKLNATMQQTLMRMDQKD